VAIEPGQRLLHYRLDEKIGEGGMGVVWKATDTDLDREVAIKILPEAFAANTERLARFEREAKLLASLNHPNLATVFGVHDADGRRFLALELIPGEDLAQRLQRGPLPVDVAIDIARQIADALEAAHERGVIHRDLKPANVRVTPAGAVKILDFGLAKAMLSDPSSGTDPSLSPTMTSVGSVAGMLLGTAAYMSPEQARGQNADERSDVWAFGCVLWECLTGKVLFGGATVTDSLGAILHTEPDWAQLPSETPPSVRRLLRRCLAKDACSRLHHIADARLELNDTEPAPQAVGRSPRGFKIATTLLAIALIATLAVVLPTLLRPTTESASACEDNPLATAKFTKVTDYPGSEFDASISPDGRFIAFVADRDGPFEIFVGQIGAGEFRSVARDNTELWEDVRSPIRTVGFNGDGSEIWFGGGPGRRLLSTPMMGGQNRKFLGEMVVNVEWSPDGERVVYHERTPGDPIYVADRDGTHIRKILHSPDGVHQHYAIWSVDEQWIYFVRGRPSTFEMDLWRVSPEGGEPEKLTEGKLNVRYPTPIDERTVLYSAREMDGAGPWLWAVDVETKVSRRVTVGLQRFASLTASADRRRLVATIEDPRSALWSVPILDHLATEGDAAPYPATLGSHALAPRFGGSSLFYLSSRGSGDGLWRIRDGEVTEVWRGNEIALLEPAALSPDGEELVLLLRREDGWFLHVMSADGAELRVLSESVDARGSAAWSPDGRWVVTGGSQAGSMGLFKIPVAGGEPVRIVEGEAVNPVWSPDGELIVYEGMQIYGPRAPLLGVRPDGDPVELPLIKVQRQGGRARFLPNGTGLIYMEGLRPSQDFWLLDLATLESRQLTQLDRNATMRTFDITPDGRQIVFDRLKENSDIVLIELEPPR
jgi:serine/threonine protein kinase/Tol biopolymer transport system component